MNLGFIFSNTSRSSHCTLCIIHINLHENWGLHFYHCTIKTSVYNLWSKSPFRQGLKCTLESFNYTWNKIKFDFIDFLFYKKDFYKMEYELHKVYINNECLKAKFNTLCKTHWKDVFFVLTMKKFMLWLYISGCIPKNLGLQVKSTIQSHLTYLEIS